MLKCPNCGHEMIWQSDFDFEDYGMDGKGIVQNFSCPECETDVIVMTPIKEEESDG